MKPFAQKVLQVLKTHKILAVSLLVVAVLLIVTAAVLVAVLSKTSEKPPVDTKPTFTNYLKPAAEIKVGKYRYISACQVLPLDDVERVFGRLNGKTYISEDYFDATPEPVDELNRRIETSCRYIGEREISLYAEQYYEGVRTDDLTFMLYPLGNDKMDEKIALYKRAISGTKDKDLQAFVAALEKSTKIYQEQQETGFDSKKVDTRNLVFPISRDMFGFNIIVNNVVYRLEQPITKDSDDEYKLPSKEIARYLKVSSKAINLIKSHANNRKLDQSPTPTIPGDTNKSGESTILEACALLTSQLYQSVTDSPANMASGRTTVYKDTHTLRLGGDGKPLSPSNSCERNGRANDTSTSLRLDMRYTKSAKELAADQAKSFKVDANDKIVQTNADWAGLFGVDRSTGPIVVFRVGSYSGTISILHTSSAGLFADITQTGGTEQQYIQLINSITDSIKNYTK